MPILSILLARWMPGVSIGRQIRDLLRWAVEKISITEKLTILFVFNKHQQQYCKQLWGKNIIKHIQIQQKDNLKGTYGFPLLYLQGGTSSRPEGKYKHIDSILPQIKSKTEHLECISDPHLLSIDDKIVAYPEKMWLVIIRYKNQLNST